MCPPPVKLFLIYSYFGQIFWHSPGNGGGCTCISTWLDVPPKFQERQGLGSFEINTIWGTFRRKCLKNDTMRGTFFKNAVKWPPFSDWWWLKSIPFCAAQPVTWYMGVPPPPGGTHASPPSYLKNVIPLSHTHIIMYNNSYLTAHKQENSKSRMNTKIETRSVMKNPKSQKKTLSIFLQDIYTLPSLIDISRVTVAITERTKWTWMFLSISHQPHVTMSWNFDQGDLTGNLFNVVTRPSCILQTGCVKYINLNIYG